MRKDYLGFFLVSLIIGFGLLFYLPLPGYMDADYYYAGARTLATGGGLNDYYIWNYLNPPLSIPFPSHQYWMPIASFIASIPILITKNSSIFIARIPFVILAAMIPPLTAYISFLFTKKRNTAILAGILALFPGYYLRFITQTDTFAVLILCGLALLFLLMRINERSDWKEFVSLGLICGVIYLSRAEGILWLIFVLGYILIVTRNYKQSNRLVPNLLFFFIGFLIISGGWFVHNYLTIGRIYPLTGSSSLWLTSYNDLFLYHPDNLTFKNWISQGWQTIISDRLKAGGINLLTFLGIHSILILIPGIIAGLWVERKHYVSRFFGAAYFLLFGLMSFVFPYAGSRGGFLHSEAVIQPFIWILAAIGWVNLVDRVPVKYQLTPSRMIFGISSLCLIISAFVVMTVNKIEIAGLQEDARISGEWLKANSGSKNIRVMTNNPPGYFIANHIPAVMIPVNGLAAVETAAVQYKVTNLVIREELFKELNLPNHFWDGSDNIKLVYQFRSSTGEQIYVLKFNRTDS